VAHAGWPRIAAARASSCKRVTQLKSHSTQHTAHSTQYSSHITQQIAHSKLHTAHSIHHSIHHTANSTKLWLTPAGHALLRPEQAPANASHNSKHTAQSTQHTAHSTQHTDHSTQTRHLRSQNTHVQLCAGCCSSAILQCIKRLQGLRQKSLKRSTLRCEAASMTWSKITALPHCITTHHTSHITHHTSHITHHTSWTSQIL
jgi:hypothetical protein